MSENNLEFPSELEINILEEETNSPISNIAISLTVYARAKNDYHLGPPLSNAHGKIIITRDWVRNAIESERNDFIMDYVTRMEDCHSKIRIKVMSLDEINRAINAMKLYGIEEGGPTIANSITDLQNAANQNYIPVELYLDLAEPTESFRNITVSLKRSQ